MAKGVEHVVACKNPRCTEGSVNEAHFAPGGSAVRPYFYAGRVVAEKGVPYWPETMEEGMDPEAVRCEVCNDVMEVVPSAVSIGRGERSRSEIGGGVIVDSPDHSVCATGREMIGKAALDAVRPGERRNLSVGGAMGFAVQRSSSGDRVTVVRDDGLAKGQ